MRPDRVLQRPSWQLPHFHIVRHGVQIPFFSGLQSALCTQYHRCRTSGKRRRPGRGQNSEKSAARSPRTDGNSSALHGRFPLRTTSSGQPHTVDRTHGNGAHNRTNRHNAGHTRQGIRIRIERLGIFRRGKIQPRTPKRRRFVRRTVGTQHRRTARRDARAGRTERKALATRLRTVEKGIALPYNALVLALGRRISRLAYGMLGHEHEIPGRNVRHTRRWHGPEIPSPRMRDSPESGTLAQPWGTLLDAREHADAQRAPHEQIHRQHTEPARTFLR